MRGLPLLVLSKTIRLRKKSHWRTLNTWDLLIPTFKYQAADIPQKISLADICWFSLNSKSHFRYYQWQTRYGSIVKESQTLKNSWKWTSWATQGMREEWSLNCSPNMVQHEFPHHIRSVIGADPFLHLWFRWRCNLEQTTFQHLRISSSLLSIRSALTATFFLAHVYTIPPPGKCFCPLRISLWTGGIAPDRHPHLSNLARKGGSMKNLLVPVWSLLIIFCLSGVSIAQRPGESATATADTIREKIEQLEKT